MRKATACVHINLSFIEINHGYGSHDHLVGARLLSGLYNATDLADQTISDA